MRYELELNLFLLLPAAMRGAIELTKARWQLAAITPQKLKERNALVATKGRNTSNSAAADTKSIELAAYVIPRVAHRLPWRGDCLIQAMAAQNWLAAKGIATAISIGVSHSETGEFEAHAWLNYDETIVTGGAISRFSPILTHDSQPN